MSAHGVEAAVRIRLSGNASCARDGRDIADDNVSSGKRVPGVLGADGVAGVQHDLMSLFLKQPAGHQPQSFGRPYNKDA